MRYSKRALLSILLAVALVIGLIPSRALALDTPGGPASVSAETSQAAVADQATVPGEASPASGAASSAAQGADGSDSKAASGPTAVTAAAASEGIAALSSASALQIGTAEDLRTFRDGVNNGSIPADTDAVLTADIDVSDLNWVPLGTSANPYAGTFDGAGQTVTFSLNSSSAWQGFFGYVASAGCVENLNLAGNSVPGNSSGALAGNNAGTFSNCSSSVTVEATSARSNVGGLVGTNSGTITGCTNNGAVTGGYNVGGIVGTLAAGSITGCTNNGAVTSLNTGANGCAGGIVSLISVTAQNTSMTIDGCSNTAAITTNTDFGCAGGIVGRENSPNSNAGYCRLQIINSYNTGALTAKDTDDLLAKVGSNVTYAYVTYPDPFTDGTYAYQIRLQRDVEPPAAEVAVSAVSVSGPVQTRQMLTATATGAGGAAPTDPQYQWQSAAAPDASFTDIAGATAATYTLKGSQVGLYVRVVVTGIEVDGVASNATSNVLGPVASSGDADDLATLNAAVEALTPYWRCVPIFGVDTNICDMLEESLAEKGFDGITVFVSAVDKPEYISTADDTTNGDITYFFKDPTTMQPMWAATVSPTFALMKGDASVVFAPVYTSLIRWDADKVRDYLNANLVPLLTEDDLLSNAESADAVTNDLTLPRYINDQRWCEVKWTSSDSSVISISPNPGTSIDDQFYGPLVGTVHRGVDDATVTLTATFTFNYTSIISTPPEDPITVTKTFDFTVKGQGPEMQAALQAELDSKLTADKLKYITSKLPIDPAAVNDDIQLLTPSMAGITQPGARTISYTSSDPDVLTINGMRGVVYQPLPGEQPKDVVLTVTLTDTTSGITVSRHIPLTIAPLTQDEIDAELDLMAWTQAHYFDGIKGANTEPDAITSDLQPFRELSLDIGGDHVWSYAYATDTGTGIIADSIPGWEGQEQWRTFKSSSPAIIANESLTVTAPQYDTEVTLQSSLSSVRFAKYAEKYPDDPQFAALKNQAVSVTLTVLGTDGAAPGGSTEPVAQRFTVTVTGLETVDGVSTAFDWVPNVEQDVSDSTTALTATLALLDKAGYTYDAAGGFLNSVTTPNGRTLGSVDLGGGNWSYWSFYINGEYATVGADQYYPRAGDRIAFVYYDASGDTATPEEPDLTPDAPRPQDTSAWPAFTGSRDTTAQTPTSADTTKLIWSFDYKGTALWTAVSEPIIAGGSIYLAADATLYKIDRVSGKVTGSVALAAPLDLTCRPLYADGVVMVPLHGGCLEAFTVDTMTAVWLTPAAIPDATYGAHQSLTTLTYADGYVLMGTAIAGASATYGGIFQSVNVATGALRWRINDAAGFYWSGAAVADDTLYVANDTGMLFALDAASGEVKESLALGAAVRSTPQIQDGVLYVVTVDGRLHQVTLKADGSFAGEKTVAFADFSTSTPTISDGRIYVGGALNDGSGVLAVINAATLKVERRVSAPADVKSAPVVSHQGAETYVYFTYNTTPGGVMVYRLGDTAAADLFVPQGDNANYCIASLTVGSDGTIYYTNDSGTLFALARVASQGGNNGGGTGSPGGGSSGGGTGGSVGGGGTNSGSSGGGNFSGGGTGGTGTAGTAASTGAGGSSEVAAATTAGTVGTTGAGATNASTNTTAAATSTAATGTVESGAASEGDGGKPGAAVSPTSASTSTKKHWSLFDLICAILTLLFAAIVLNEYLKRLKVKTGAALRLVTLVAALASLIFAVVWFILKQDLAQSMALFDSWAPIFATCVVVSLLACGTSLFARRVEKGDAAG